MPYFVARSVFSITLAGKAGQRTFEELTFLITARDAAKAYEDAYCLSLSNESDFVNINNRKVSWKFEGIAHLEAIEAPEHGCILLSELKENYSAEQVEHLFQRIGKTEKTFTQTEQIPDYIP